MTSTSGADPTDPAGAIESAAAYRLLAENASDVVFRGTTAGVVEWMSDSVQDLLGWSPDQIIGRPIGEFVAAESAASLSDIQAALAEGRPGIGELRLKASDGTYRWVSAVLRPLRADSGNIIARAGSWKDIGAEVAARRGLELLAEGNRIVLRAADEDDLIARMCWAAASVGGYAFAWYGVPLHDAEQTVQVVAVGGDDHGYMKDLRVSWGEGPLGQGPTGISLRTRTTQVRNDLSSSPDFSPWVEAARERGICCSISLPVVVGDEVHGALMVYGLDIGAFDEGARTLLESLAANIAYGIAQRREASALAASESRYRLMAENTTDVIALTDSHMRWDWVSPSVTSLLGLRPEEAVGLGASDLLHPDDARMLRERLTEVDPAAPLNARLRFRHADGTWRWTSASGQGVIGPDGRVTGRVIAIRDATDQVRAEQEIAERSRMFRLVAENASDLVFRSNMSGQIEWISPSVTQSLGWGTDELIGSSSVDLMHPEDREIALAAREQARAGTPATIEVRLQRSDGSYRAMSVVMRPLVEDGGAIIGHVSGCRDIEGERRALDALRGERARLATTLDSLMDPHVTLEPIRDAAGVVVDFVFSDGNRSACQTLRRTKEQLIGARVSVVWPSDEADGLLARYVRVLETGEPLVLNAFGAVSDATGELRYFDLRIVRIGDALSYTWRDVTDERTAAAALADSEARYRLIAENALDVVIRAERDGVITWVSPSAAGVLGWEPAELIGRAEASLIHPDDLVSARERRSELAAAGVSGGEIEARYATKDGGWRWFRIQGRALTGPDGQLQGGIDTLRDIDAEVATRARLAFEVEHDSLTGLPSRTLLLKALAEERDASAQGRSPVLLCVGVDGLDEITQAFTHTAADRVLATVARRLTDAAIEGATLARTGDNEIAVLLADSPRRDHLIDLVARLQELVGGAVTMGTQDIAVTVSVGIASDLAGDSELLRDGSAALQRAKEAGGNRWEFADPHLAQEARDRLVLQSGLQEALASGQIRAWYQPVVSLPDGRLRGHETLARWVRSDGGIVPPDSFIPVAERTGLVVAIDAEMLRQALEVLRELPADLHIAVNLSPASLMAPDLRGRITSALERSGVPASRLRLEVTETALLHVTNDIATAMRDLSEAGITWWVDDFGTGYSSLSHLRDMPVQGIKLDRSFTSGITADDPTRRRLAQGLAGLAQGLGMATVAEGVETQQEADILAEQGWDLAQGWLFGRPTPEASTA